MRTSTALLAVTLAVASLAPAALAVPKHKSSHSAASQTVAELERRGGVDETLAKRMKEDPDAPVTRYDIASFVARAMQISAAARSQQIVEVRQLMQEMSASTTELGGRLEKLAEQQQELHERVRQLREEQRR
ncbi:MAG: hypothetical protein HY303_08905 [Candidatus Wallbacteria bacterium]|nr:hypothetical protein [Candidatus Wallbacteria bacterium]